jgi:chorismate synthase
MNSFGRIFRLAIYGESHGQAIGAVIDGCPPGIHIDFAQMIQMLDRRKPGGKGTTTRIEADLPEILSGYFNEFTTGSPLHLLIRNNNTRSQDYEGLRATPRPGHADFVAREKFKGFEDYRGGGHFSGRLTAIIVAAGSIAKDILTQKFNANLDIQARVTEIGGDTDLEAALQKAIQRNDSVGGLVECRVNGLPIGLGEPFFDSLESMLAHGVFSIPAIKGIEFGSGFSAGRMYGSSHNDAITDLSGHTLSNNAGGINGGLSNGNELVFRIAVKPPSSTPATQHTLNIETGEMQDITIAGRHDLCIALRVPVVLEAITAIVLTDLFMLRG